MKLLVTTDSIISLEDVRRVERRVIESKHTSCGEKYTVKHYEIIIIYCDGTNEHVHCGDDYIGEKACAEFWLDIFDKLSED